MITKIINIKNVGTFENYTRNSSQLWNGDFEKINIIYAPNGSGKTTLATIFNSLSKNKPELVLLKQTFNKTELPSIKLHSNSTSGIIEFSNKEWNQDKPDIEVFDIHFIEDYLFNSSLVSKKNVTNLLSLILGERGANLRKQHKNKLVKKKKTETRLKQLLDKTETKKTIKQKKELNDLLILQENLIKECINEFELYSKPVFEKYINSMNKYLSRFTSNIKLHSFINPIISFEAEKLKPSLNICVAGKIIRFKSPDLSKKVGNVKFALSEGDKNAIALSFFLARLDIIGTEDKIIVFDDPLSSFDQDRKTSTTYLLSKLAIECKQFFLLTHDIHFAKAVTDKLSFSKILNLKILKSLSSSELTNHNIQFDTLSGFQKDLITMKNYLSNTSQTEQEKREVIRCIRPVLESIIKTKYFDVLNYNDWLGDIISKVKKSTGNESVSNLKPVYQDLIELNDFSKQFHHSENTPLLISNNELEFYIKLLIKTIGKI